MRTPAKTDDKKKPFQKKGNRNSKSSNFNSKRKAGQFEDKVEGARETKADKFNDPSWYLKSPLMAKDVSSINFNNPVGVPYYLDGSNTDGVVITAGVMNLYAAMGPGVSMGATSGIDTAMRSIFANIRSKISGTRPYSAAEVMKYIIAVGSGYAYYAWLTRLYGLAQLYVQSNKYYGAHLIRACGVDPTDIVSNLPAFRSYLNQYALRLGVFWVPNNMDIFKRWVWMFSNMYADEDTAKAQIYMYQPAYIHIYNDGVVPSVLDATAVCLGSDGEIISNMPLTTVQGIGDLIIRRLQGSSDILTISGDILRTYGQENCATLNLIPEGYTVLPVFSEEVLLQIHNTTPAGGKPCKVSGTTVTPGYASFNISEDPNINAGSLIWAPEFTKAGNLSSNKFLDSWRTEVTPEEVMVATRNMVFGRTKVVGGVTVTSVTACGTEIILCLGVSTLDIQGNLVTTVFMNDDTTPSGTTLYDAWLTMVTKMNYFNEHPLIYNVQYQDNGLPKLLARRCFGELSNYAMVDEVTMKPIHDVAIMSLFDVPVMSNIVKA